MVFGTAKKASTGIHIGGDGLRVVELSNGEQGVQLNSLIHRELSGTFQPGFVDSPEGRAELIQSLVELKEERGLHFKNSVVSLHHHSFQLKQRSLPAGADRESRAHLEWEAEQILADDPKAYGIDFVQSTSTGFIVAAHRQLIRHYQEVFASAKIRGVDFDVAPFALFNTLEFTEVVTGEQVELLVDVASDRAWAILVRSGEIDAVSQCSWDREDQADDHLEEVHDCLSSMLEICEETKPDRLLISGIESREGMWRVQLPDHLHISGALVDPFRGVDISPLNKDDTTQLAIRSAFALPAGLAYRGLLT